MAFSGKSNNEAPEKRRSFFGTLYNPRIGDSIKPIGQSFSIFVNLIAMIFAMNGLFPKDHPALRNEPGYHLRLSDVVETAWNQLSFTKQGFPKVIIFVAVIGCLLCAVFSVLTAIALAFMGQAHAQNYFTPGGVDANVQTGTDIGYNIIDYLFGANNGGANSVTGFNNLSTAYTNTAGGVMPNMGLQSALWTALGYYSNAMLVFAGILLFYHLMSMIIDTAHSGVVMGRRANQVWAPIRLAVAVILLVPVNGLNAGQMLVMQAAQWGSGLASNVWSTFKLGMATNNKLSMLTPKDTQGTVIDLINMGACEYYINYNLYNHYRAFDTPSSDTVTAAFINGWTNGYNGPGAAVWDNTGTPVAPATNSIGSQPQETTNQDGSTTLHFQPLTIAAGQEDGCGSITIPPPPAFSDANTNTIAKKVWDLHILEFSKAFAAAMKYAPDNVPQFLVTAGANGDLAENGTSAADIYLTYQKNLVTGLQAIATAGYATSDKHLAMGWVAAGAYFNQVARVQGILQAVSRDYMPTTHGPKGGTPDGFSPWLMTVIGQKVQAQQQLGNTVIATPGGACTSAFWSWDSIGSIGKTILETGGNVADTLLSVADRAAGSQGVWCAGGGIRGVVFTGSNPLAQMAGWGHSNMNLAMDLFHWGILFKLIGHMAGDSMARATMGAAVAAIGIETAIGSIAAAAWSSVASAFGFEKTSKVLAKGATMAAEILGLMAGGVVLGEGMGTIGGGLIGLGSIFFTLGVLFGFFLPLLPFLHFFLGVISWIALLFEAVIAMPLVALSHITPEGEGISGPSAKGAYQMAFSILLRPTLMIFGLIVGFLVLSLAVSILNMFFAGAFSDANAGAGIHEIVTKIIGTIIYVMIVISVANHAFQLITRIPDKVMAWGGMQGARGDSMGDVGKMEFATVAGAKMLSAQGFGGMGEIARGAGGAGGQALGNQMRAREGARQLGTQQGRYGGAGAVQPFAANLAAVRDQASQDRAMTGSANYLNRANETERTGEANIAAATATQRHNELATIGGLNGSRLNQVIANTGNMATSSASMQQSMERTANNTDQMQQDMSAMKEDTGAIKDNTGNMQQDVSAMKEDTGAIKDTTGRMDENLASTATNTRNMQQDVSAMKEDTGSIKENVDRVVNPQPPEPVIPNPSSGAGGSPISLDTNIGSARNSRRPPDEP